MNPPQQAPDGSGDVVAFVIVTVVLNAIVQGIKDKSGSARFFEPRPAARP